MTSGHSDPGKRKFVGEDHLAPNSSSTAETIGATYASPNLGQAAIALAACRRRRTLPVPPAYSGDRSFRIAVDDSGNQGHHEGRGTFRIILQPSTSGIESSSTSELLLGSRPEVRVR